MTEHVFDDIPVTTDTSTDASTDASTEALTDAPTDAPTVSSTPSAPLTCENLVATANQEISYAGGCSIELNCRAEYSCTENYELVGGATSRTCGLPSDNIPVWSGNPPRCERLSESWEWAVDTL